MSTFGLKVIEVNGHKESEIKKAFNEDFGDKTKVIVANTIKGKGISFMENDNDWHHNRLIKDKYECAYEEISKE